MQQLIYEESPSEDIEDERNSYLDLLTPYSLTALLFTVQGHHQRQDPQLGAETTSTMLV